MKISSLPILRSTPFRATALAASFAFIQTASFAADPAGQPTPEPIRMVDVEAHFVRASGGQIQQALEAAGLNTDGSVILSPEQREKVFESLKAAGADFFASPRTVSMAGQRATVSSVREVRYPCGYEAAKDGSGKLVPTTFAARNAGVVFDFESVADPSGKLIDLTLFPEVTTFLGFIDESSEKPGRDPHDPHALEDMLRQPSKEGDRWDPVFASNKMTTQVTIPSGKTIFLGALPDASPSDSAAGAISSDGGKRQIYVFVTARTISE